MWADFKSKKERRKYQKYAPPSDSVASHTMGGILPHQTTNLVTFLSGSGIVLINTCVVHKLVQYCLQIKQSRNCPLFSANLINRHIQISDCFDVFSVFLHGRSTHLIWFSWTEIQLCENGPNWSIRMTLVCAMFLFVWLENMWRYKARRTKRQNKEKWQTLFCMYLEKLNFILEDLVRQSTDLCCCPDNYHLRGWLGVKSQLSIYISCLLVSVVIFVGRSFAKKNEKDWTASFVILLLSSIRYWLGCMH